ncbi:hypothetical protein Trydic_g9164 [Trypoxylus dichotomus]
MVIQRSMHLLQVPENLTNDVLIPSNHLNQLLHVGEHGFGLEVRYPVFSKISLNIFYSGTSKQNVNNVLISTGSYISSTNKNEIVS